MLKRVVKLIVKEDLRAMKTKSIRIPKDMMAAIELVEKEEKIEESTAMRKLIRIGFETYVGNLYKQGKVTLREADRLLKLSQIETMNLFLDAGIKGNLSDRTVFKEQFRQIINRFKAISGSLEDITLVFDQGNSSKKVLQEVNSTVSFVGSVSPYHQRPIIEEANRSMGKIKIKGRSVDCYRMRTNIWQMDLTVVVYISEKLRQGQIRGVEQSIKKLFERLKCIQEKVKVPSERGKKRDLGELEKRITALIASSVPEGLVGWCIEDVKRDAFELDFWIDQDRIFYLIYLSSFWGTL